MDGRDRSEPVIKEGRESLAKVLILDGHSPAALAFARSLGRSGDWVAVGSNRGISAPAAYSRYCQKSFEYPISTDDATAFVRAVLDFVQTQKIELVVPMTDWTNFPLSQYRDQFAGICRLAVPSHSALELAADKYRTIQLAQSLHIPSPDTWLIRSLQEFDILSELNFPVVVKDRSSARWLDNRAVFGSVSYPYSKDELRRHVERRLELAGDVLLQRFVTGAGIGFSCVASNGKTFLPFQWLRIREADPRGSGSSSRKSTALDPDIHDYGSKLITQAGFEGMAMVEFKRDPITGQPILMEINGRPWGSLQLPIASGIDYPHYLVDWCLHGALPPEEIAYQPGITCRRLVGELSHLENLRRGKPPNWPAAYPNFWTSLAKIVVPWYPGVCYEELSLADPRPGWVALYHWFSSRLRRKKQSDNAKSKLTVKGIVHCHTTFSNDGTLSVDELCGLLRQEGFDFVGLTEHTKGLSPERYEEFVRECKSQSSEKFAAIPGLEFRSPDGTEIAGIGLYRSIDDQPPPQMTAEIRAAGGFAIWVHPFKTGRWNGPFLECDAVEVMNGKLDGILAPNLGLLRAYRRLRREGRGFHALFGLDFHNVRQTRNVWIECQVEKLTVDGIVRALREGNFVSRTAHGSMSSDGKISLPDYLTMIGLRMAFLTWAAALRSVPRSVRSSLLAASRPLIRMLKRRS